ncbi:uncharacterized protein LOC142606325 [Castanea sativa]|uniref:uncharacterized protein LOC142606325 n=1 Tax=Castanea sativa TaxID=21020 RepID=UPI003F64B6B8
MEVEFLERIQNMTLTTDEDEVMPIRPTQRAKVLEEFSISLIGKFLTTKPINIQAAKNLLRSMWKLGEDLKIVEVGDGLLQFKFLMESQLMWVWNNGPRCFDNHILALRRWEKGMSVRNVTFMKQTFWIQVWGLPFDLITEEAGSDIGRTIGDLVEVDCKAFNSDQSRFLRIRVEVPLNKPLRRGGPVSSPEGEISRVAFRYERLVGWCFNCGRIGHEHSDCALPVSIENGGRPYGEWLKAGSRTRNTEPIKESTMHEGIKGRLLLLHRNPICPPKPIPKHQQNERTLKAARYLRNGF